jgi:DNA-binding SARP family transcriptional activator
MELCFDDHVGGTRTPIRHRPVPELRLLGGFELRVDGQPVELPPGVERLIAFVALTPRGLNRDFAAFQLWPDKTEARARANLRSTLWRLNRLGAEIISVTTSRLRLSSEVWLDLQNLINELEDPQRAASLPFGTLLPDLLPDWYDDWLTVERERFRQLSLAALEERARVAFQAGDTGSAIQFALASIAIDGTRMSAHHLVVEAHLAEGNEWEAARERCRYARCRESLFA